MAATACAGGYDSSVICRATPGPDCSRLTLSIGVAALQTGPPSSATAVAAPRAHEPAPHRSGASWLLVAARGQRGRRSDQGRFVHPVALVDLAAHQLDAGVHGPVVFRGPAELAPAVAVGAAGFVELVIQVQAQTGILAVSAKLLADA